MPSVERPIKTPPLKVKRFKKKVKLMVYEDMPCRAGCGSTCDPLNYESGFCSRVCAYGDQYYRDFRELSSDSLAPDTL